MATLLRPSRNPDRRGEPSLARNGSGRSALRPSLPLLLSLNGDPPVPHIGRPEGRPSLDGLLAAVAPRPGPTALRAWRPKLVGGSPIQDAEQQAELAERKPPSLAGESAVTRPCTPALQASAVQHLQALLTLLLKRPGLDFEARVLRFSFADPDIPLPKTTKNARDYWSFQGV